MENNDIRDRVTRAETNIENMKENFANYSAEVRENYKKLFDEVAAMKSQLVKLFVIVTILAQGADAAIKTLLGS